MPSTIHVNGEAERLRAMQPVYPLMLTNLAGTHVVVVGGGMVANRKVMGLLAADAAITVIAPELGEELRVLHGQGAFVWEPRAYQSGDLVGARLAFAATNVRAVNAQVAVDAAGERILCNVADDPAAGDFHAPAVHRADGMVIAVSSSGQSPRRATSLRNRIAKWLAQGE
ncbi:MAG: bifunctional precorrin-2 dehydrogenase/sirohydrochlorin ferrochelatase [Caldilineaceae bacterium]|nr:bifunctional precorrin-2 dehydrogenase/sirohydrochlorin ferrochelatase [Caldilineaceae bacterium]